MASKSMLYVQKAVQKKVNAAAKAPDYQMETCDLEVHAPDDRRVDKALAAEKTLAAEFEKVCKKSADDFVRDAARHLTTAQTEYEKIKDDKNAVGRLFSTTFKGMQDTFAAFEKDVVAGTGKVWKGFAAENDEYRGARFNPVVTQWLGRFTAPKAPKPDPMGVTDLKSADELYRLLVECGVAAKAMCQRLKTVCDDLDKMPAHVTTLNSLLDTLQKEYDSGTRESQKDDPATDPDAEPDEDQLDAAIFARYYGQIDKVWTDLLTDTGLLIDSADIATDISKELTEILKGIAKAQSTVKLPDNQAEGVEKIADAATQAIKTLVSAASKAKAAKKPLETSYGVFDALKEKKSGALGLLSDAKITVSIPTKEFATALSQLQPVAKHSPV